MFNLFPKPTNNQSPVTSHQSPGSNNMADFLAAGSVSTKDLIAPSAMDIKFDHIKMGGKYVRTLFVFTYPRYLYTNWLSPIINFDQTLDISMFIYPIETKVIMENLRKKVGQMESAMMISAEKGQVRDPALETALEDAEEMRDALQKGLERFFQFALYFTIYADSKKELDAITKTMETSLSLLKSVMHRLS